MGTTVNGLPYPDSGDPPDVPTDMRQLAEAVDAELTRQGEWLAWTPTVTGTSVQSTMCRYQRSSAASVTFQIGVTVATLTGPVTISLPIPSNAPGNYPVTFTDVGSNGYMGWASISGSIMTVNAISTANHAYVGLSPTVPFTWAPGDYLTCGIHTYRCDPNA